MKIINALSVNMLPIGGGVIRYAPITLEDASCILRENGVESAVGHLETAQVFSLLLGLEVPFNRVTVSLSYGEKAVLGQYIGPRPPEGATTLPEGATIRWFLVEVLPPDSFPG